MTRLILAAAILLGALAFLVTHRVRPAEVQITPAKAEACPRPQNPCDRVNCNRVRPGVIA